MKIDKITLKLIKYFIAIISIAILIAFIGSSIFISQFYKKNEFNILKNSAHEIENSLNEGYTYDDLSINAILIKDNTLVSIGRKKMGIINSLKNIDFKSLNEMGTFENMGKQTFLYYKLDTAFGSIITFQNSKLSSNFLKAIYIILLVIFLIALSLCIPLISYVGKKFTRPILILKKASQKIAHGDFTSQIKINTKDEIQDLATSLNAMSIDLEKKYTLQKEFIANVSHDFKTPLSVMRSYAEAIKDGIVTCDNAKEYANEIINEADRLNLLVMEILELSKLQNSSFSLTKESININSLLKECIQKFLPIANKKNIFISLNADSCNIYGNKTYLMRAIYNFIDNAIKFTPENETIKVFTSLINEKIKISIVNTGKTISKEIIDNIWNRYYKNSKSGGMGLGLPICKEILELHNFDYGVLSKDSKTEFYFIASIIN